MAVATEPSMDL